MATSLVPCTIKRFVKLVQWSLQERLCKISCINKVCLATSSIMCITNNNASHPSAHITVGIAHNVLHISAILNAQKHKYISMNLQTKAHSWTLKLSPFSSSSSYTTPIALLTHLLNKLRRLKLFLVYPQRMPQEHRHPSAGVGQQKVGHIPPTSWPAKGFLRPPASGTAWFQMSALQHHLCFPSEGAPQVTKSNYLKVLIKMQVVLIIS